MSAEDSTLNKDSEERSPVQETGVSDGVVDRASPSKSSSAAPTYDVADRDPQPPKSLKGRKLFIGGVSWDTTDGRSKQ